MAEARQSAELLADVYRALLVETQKHWVKPGVPAGARTTQKLFHAMEVKGWPQARWLAVSNRALNKANNPRDEFERAASRQIRAGKPWVETVEGGRYRAVAGIAFDGACIGCHYGERPSDFFGGLVINIPLRTGK